MNATSDLFCDGSRGIFFIACKPAEGPSCLKQIIKKTKILISSYKYMYCILYSLPTPVLEGMHLNYSSPTALALVLVFFYESVVNPWNNLPSNTDFSSLSAFKRFISNIDFSNYLKRYWFLSSLFLFYWLYCDFTVLVHFCIALLLFSYRVYCRGAIRALEPGYSCYIICYKCSLVMLRFLTNKPDDNKKHAVNPGCDGGDSLLDP